MQGKLNFCGLRKCSKLGCVSSHKLGSGLVLVPDGHGADDALSLSLEQAKMGRELQRESRDVSVVISCSVFQSV